MKALSVRQPWAWLIVNGHKDVENRTRTIKHRGHLAIHASKKIDMGEFARAEAIFGRPIDPASLQYGGIVGVVAIVGVTQQSKSKWFSGPFGWLLKNAKPTAFHRCAGKIGLFNIHCPSLAEYDRDLLNQ
jgi:hypothetical protein